MSEEQKADKPQDDDKPALFKKLDDDFWVSGNLGRDDFKRAKEEGFKTLIDLLPEKEDYKKVQDDEAAKICAELGVEYRYLPLYGFQVKNQYVVDMFEDMTKDLPRPWLVYCKAGDRSTSMWAMLHATDMDHDESDDVALDQGYDIEIVTQSMENRSAHLQSRKS